MNFNKTQFILNVLSVFLIPIATFSQKISAKEMMEQQAKSILVENFYQISTSDYNNLFASSSTGFLQDDKCFIQNFSSETGAKGQILIQIDFGGRLQYLGLSKVFVDKTKKNNKPKIILINSLDNCISGINSNWQIADCISRKLIEFIGD